MLYKGQPKIEQIEEYGKPVSAWGGPGIVFHVKNGRGVLYQTFGAVDDHGIFCLMFEGIPLIKFHGDEYMCPTCEKLISAGYGINKAGNPVLESLRECINAPFVSLEKSLQDLSLLFGLLPSGYYALVDTSLYPTDGAGNFFWSVCNIPINNQATCPIYEDGNWASETPAFLLPSQPPSRFNPIAAQKYRDNRECRAIAYSLGSVCVLLDGHHKATAAALDGRKVKTLLIMPKTGVVLPHEANDWKAALSIGGHTIDIARLGLGWDKAKTLIPAKQMSTQEAKKYLELVNNEFDFLPWSPELLSTAKQYPDARTLAYIQWAGELTEERIDAIMTGAEQPNEHQMKYICTAMFLTNHTRFYEVTLNVGRNERYIQIWHDVFKLLAKSRNDQADNFFIDFLVSDDRVRPNLTRIADEYFSGNDFPASNFSSRTT